MDKNANKNTNECNQCQFYNKESNDCKVKSTKEFREYNYSKKNNEKCNDFLIKDKLVMF